VSPVYLARFKGGPLEGQTRMLTFWPLPVQWEVVLNPEGIYNKIRESQLTEDHEGVARGAEYEWQLMEVTVMRRFYFVRQTDVSGTSGTGAVCEAVLLSDGRVILRWLTYLSSIAIYNSLEDAIAIHGHDGQTDIEWVDEEPSTAPTPTERPPGWSAP
jgi:hypothetical protein